MSDVLLLTDDEVVALATARMTPWPGGLPTVDISSREKLASASFRGNRSLLVRGLRQTEAQGSEAESMADGVLAAQGRILVYLGASDFQRAGWGLSSSHYSARIDWVLETISPVGIHRLGRQPFEDHKAYLEALLRAALEAGPEATDESTGPAPEWLCMVGDGPTGATLAVAKRGALLVGDADVSTGVPRPTGSLQPADASIAVAQLFSAAGARAEDLDPG